MKRPADTDNATEEHTGDAKRAKTNDNRQQADDPQKRLEAQVRELTKAWESVVEEFRTNLHDSNKGKHMPNKIIEDMSDKVNHIRDTVLCGGLPTVLDVIALRNELAATQQCYIDELKVNLKTKVEKKRKLPNFKNPFLGSYPLPTQLQLQKPADIIQSIHQALEGRLRVQDLRRIHTELLKDLLWLVQDGAKKFDDVEEQINKREFVIQNPHEYLAKVDKILDALMKTLRNAN